MVTARTLPQQLKIPLFTVSTLAAIAFDHPSQMQSCSSIIAVQMPTQRGEFFVGIYEKKQGFTPLLSDRVMTLEEWKNTLKNCQNSYQLIEVNQGEKGEDEKGLGETVKAVLELAHLEKKLGISPHWSDALPYYGQHPVKGYSG